MSLYVRVRGCRPSVLAKAFARLVAGPVPVDGWGNLDQEGFLEKGLSDSGKGGLRCEFEQAYFADREEVVLWDKVLRAIPGAPEERYKVDARRFAVARRRECLDRMKGVEECRPLMGRDAFALPMRLFIEQQFGKKKHAYPAFIPGACMQIRIKGRPIFLDLLPLPWVTGASVGLRFASHGEAAQFLKLLGGLTQIRLMDTEGCRCEVAREGTRFSIIEMHGLVGAGIPERCLELLEDEDGRAVARREFSSYNKEGLPIPV